MKISKIIIFLPFSVLLVFFLIGLIKSGNPQKYTEEKAKEAEEAIKNSPTLQALDAMCDGLPKPDKFQYVGKSLGVRRVYINHFYASDLDFEEVKAFYKTHFEKEGWKLKEEGGVLGRYFITFEKNQYEIEIDNDNGATEGRGNYSFSCKY